MSSEAVFSTERRANETVFHVQPALAGGRGFFTLASIVWWMFVFGISTNPVFLTGMFFLWLFTLGAALRGIILETRKRVPVTITANARGLSVRDQFYPKDDIADFSLTTPTGGEVASSTNLSFAGTGVTGATFALGAAALQGTHNNRVAAQARHNARSFSLTLRKRTHSKPITLVYGLTSQPGEALMNDLIEAMR
jgi:hypothetical protein